MIPIEVTNSAISITLKIIVLNKKTALKKSDALHITLSIKYGKTGKLQH